MWPFSLIDWSMVLDWVELVVRWMHVIAGIAWIGSSFYFIALDASLQRNPRLDPKVSGESWQVHGGGFYQIQKFIVAPEFLPKHLTWFKWEAYATWIFGFGLLVLAYYAHPSLYLLDSSVSDITVFDAIPGTGWCLPASSSPASWCGTGSTRCTPAPGRIGACGRPRPYRSSAHCC